MVRNPRIRIKLSNKKGKTNQLDENPSQDDSEKQVDALRSLYTATLRDKIFLNFFVCTVLGLVVLYLLTLFSKDSLKENAKI